MDYQRKEVYGYRQEILEGANCKIRILEMLDKQIDLAVDALPGPRTTARQASPSSRRSGSASSSTPRDFARSDFAEAEKTAREKASRDGRRRNVQEMHGGKPRRRGREGVELAGAGAPGQHPLGPEDDRPRS